MAKIPINIATGTIQPQHYIVGIDLGTTNSLVAIVNNETHQPFIIKEIDGSVIVPSLVFFADSSILVGNQAVPELINNNPHCISSIKRLMGQKFTDISEDLNFYNFKVKPDLNGEPTIPINDMIYTPQQIAAFILKELKQRAEHILKAPVNFAVITVPAYFNDYQRQATIEAGKIAGLEVLRIINEPTAASLAYGLNKKFTNKKIAVYDFGGGTFDISILELDQGVFEVLSTYGDTRLGGDDIDQAIVNFWCEEYKDLNPIPGIKNSLRNLATTAKIFLSNNLTWHSQFNNHTIGLTIEQLQTLLNPIISKTIHCCKQALKDANLTPEDIDEIVLVGGSTRIPYIKEKLKDVFKAKLNDSLNPEEVVALGAAIQADILQGNNSEILLLDVTPLSLGLETMGGLMDFIIPRNTKIPTKYVKQYTTQKDGQTGLCINIYQGERDLVANNRSLGSFILKGIPAMPAGLPKIELTFFVDTNGILTVKAQELRTGISQQITINFKKDLTDQSVENLILDSLNNSQNDMEQRAVIQIKNEIQQLLDRTQQIIKSNQHLSPEENEILQNQANLLIQALLSNDKAFLNKALENFNQITQPLAEKILNLTISESLKGKKI